MRCLPPWSSHSRPSRACWEDTLQEVPDFIGSEEQKQVRIRCTPESRHCGARVTRPLCAKSGHWPQSSIVTASSPFAAIKVTCNHRQDRRGREVRSLSRAFRLKTGQIEDIDERNEGITCSRRRCRRMRAQGCAEYTQA